jgi:hypothetical protein
LSVATACVVAPWVSDGFASATVTVSTGFPVTVRLAEPPCPSLVAMMLAVPTVTAVTTPVAFTVAIGGAEVDQVTVLPVSRLPDASRSTAVAGVVSPAPRLELASVTVTVETGAG